jgi:hypothetical protein
MSIVQFYKSQLKVGSNLFPVPPGGGTLNWPKNHSIPMIAGNYWQINYIEGYQVPSIDATFALLDANVDKCPITPTLLNSHFITRSNDYSHDTSAIVNGIEFFDGYSGYAFTGAKANSFSLSGSKGDDVRFNASYLLFGDEPTVSTSVPDGTYPPFLGSPIRFQALSFKKNGSFMDGVLSFNISFSNNLTDDRSMVGEGPQSNLPVDANAGVQTCSAMFSFQANSTQHIASGDVLEVWIDQDLIATKFIMNAAVVETPNNRQIGSGRQVRPYACTMVGTSNSVGPLTIS